MIGMIWRPEGFLQSRSQTGRKKDRRHSILSRWTFRKWRTNSATNRADGDLQPGRNRNNAWRQQGGLQRPEFHL